MDLKALGKKIIGIGAPFWGTAIGRPAGGAIGSMLACVLGCKNEPGEIAKAIDAKGPSAATMLTEFQARHVERLEEIALDRARIESAERLETIRQVNMTMRAETKSEHWPQWAWRPFNGFLFGAAIVAIYFVLPLIKVEIPDVPVAIWLLWGSILGVATIGRNQEKRAAAGDTAPGMLQQFLTAIKN
jgi:hypothetical protein